MPASTLSSSSTANDDTSASPPLSKTIPNDAAPGVNVHDAEEEFEQLRRQLTRQSSLHRTATRQKDSEKEGEEGEEFDLLEYMRSRASERDANGFKSKQVGVVWEGLAVTGAGGMKVRRASFSILRRC